MHTPYKWHNKWSINNNVEFTGTEPHFSKVEDAKKQKI